VALNVAYLAPSKSLCTALLLSLCIAVKTSAGDWAHPGTHEPRFRIGVHTWLSHGSGTWQINGALSPYVDFRSRLDWDDIDSDLLIFEAGFLLGSRVRLQAAYGTGNIEDGRNIDSDWLLLPGSSPFTLSESISETHGQATFLDVDIALNVLPGGKLRREPLRVDVLLGYLHVKDEVIDEEGIQTVVDETPVYDPLPSGRNATYDFEWHACRAGLSALFLPAPRVRVSAVVAALLGVTHRGEGFWNLRTDMRSYPPNMVNKADFGWGSDLTLRFAYVIAESVAVEIGWKALYLEVENGTHDTFFRDGEVGKVHLDSVTTTREGFLAGLFVRF